VTEHAAWHAAGIASDASPRMVGARHNIKPYPPPSEPAGKIYVTGLAQARRQQQLLVTITRQEFCAIPKWS
jgi:hypothetical protein